MVPTEGTILSNFLLAPAALPAIISQEAFTALFPRSQQSSPQIRKLYRDIQHQRALVIDVVARQIAIEVEQGQFQSRAVTVERRKELQQKVDCEAGLETMVS